MSKKFLISFCNNKTHIKSNGTGYFGLLTVDVKNQNYKFEDLHLNLPADLTGNGITGMCLHNNQIVLLLQRMPSTLVFLDKAFNFIDYWPIENIRGVHSILSKNNEIYLSVTNQDKIIAINTEKKIKEVWTKNTEKDTIHLNSICLHKKLVHATAFGPKASELWSSAQSGMLFNINSNNVIINNIWHPHSSFSFNGELYCCDSSNQRVIGENTVLLKNLPGYSRGLFIDENMILCGSSQGRQVSHSTGVKISNKSDKGKIAGQCGLTVHFKESQLTKFIDFNNKALEVFDILQVN
ncbi:MAG: DUF4915 domain-containing protein [Marinicellaceae bacterium]